MSKAKDLRNLERKYRRRRAELLEDPGLSWEKKMLAIRDLYTEFVKISRDGTLLDPEGAA